jgi:hypothetical protein
MLLAELSDSELKSLADKLGSSNGYGMGLNVAVAVALFAILGLVFRYLGTRDKKDERVATLASEAQTRCEQTIERLACEHHEGMEQMAANHKEGMERIAVAMERQTAIYEQQADKQRSYQVASDAMWRDRFHTKNNDDQKKILREKPE